LVVCPFQPLGVDPPLQHSDVILAKVGEPTLRAEVLLDRFSLFRTVGHIHGAARTPGTQRVACGEVIRRFPLV
jgi:hypothetical protein